MKQINALDQNQQWLNTAKNSLKENTVRRLTGRIDRLEKVINAGVSPYGTRFVIDDTLKKKIMNQLLLVIDEYPGTRKLAKGEEKSLKDVMANTRTWWNRYKSLQLGSYLFSVICYYILHHFIQSHLRSLSAPEKLILFIDIFISFMDETIKFPKTKPKPLIVQQCFLHVGNFKTICDKFVSTFGGDTVKWYCDMPSTGACVSNGKTTLKYIKKKNRTQSLCDEFYQCLHEMKYKWATYNPNTNNSVNIHRLNREWNEILAACTPKEYSLQFYKVASATTATDTSSTSECDSVSVESGSKSPKNSKNPRTFQGMNNFGSELTTHDHNATANAMTRGQRQEAHIQQMRNSAESDVNATVNEPCDDFQFQTWTSWESDQESTFTMI